MALPAARADIAVGGMQIVAYALGGILLLYLDTPALFLSAAAALGFLAPAGYSASLPLQERLISHTSPEARGQVLGPNSTGLMAMQGMGAVLAGLLIQRLHGGPAAASTAIGLIGGASLAVTLALIPGLRRTRPRREGYGPGMAPGGWDAPAATPDDQRSSTLPSRQ